MIPLGLSAAEQREFHRALNDSHDIDVRVALLDMEENALGDLSGWVLGGQVVADMDAEVTRSLQVTLLDPGRRSGIDPDAPERSARLDRMVHVSYGVWVDALGEWVRVPVFRGPITKAGRDGAVLEVEALGKEHLMRTDGGIVHTYAAGRRRTSVIRDIARRAGERRMVIPTWAPRVSKKGGIPKLGKRSDPWPWLRKLADSMRGQIWYDGAGTLRLRKHPTRICWWWTEGSLLSEPRITTDDQAVINFVRVTGQPPEGKKWKIEGEAPLPAWHGHSPQRLGRRGVPRYLVEEIEDDSIRTSRDAQAAADRRIREVAVESYSAEFDCLPVPHLDLGDVCHLAWDDAPGAFRLRRFTLPLTAGEAMSVGYHRETRRRLRSRAPGRAGRGVIKTKKKTTISGGTTSGRL